MTGYAIVRRVYPAAVAVMRSIAERVTAQKPERSVTVERYQGASYLVERSKETGAELNRSVFVRCGVCNTVQPLSGMCNRCGQVFDTRVETN